MIKIVGVRFRNAGKVYYFDPMEFTLRIGDHVIVETSKGPEYGVVSTGLKPVEDDQVSQPLRSVLRVAEWMAFIKPLFPNDLDRDNIIYDGPNPMSNIRDYRLTYGTDKENYFKVRKHVIDSIP